MFSLKKGVPIASIYEKGNGKDKEVGKLYLNLNSKKSDERKRFKNDPSE